MADADRQAPVLSGTNDDSAALLQTLADGSLPPARFTHAQHLKAGWACLRDAACAGDAETRFCTLLQTYVRHIGAQAKYHHTLSVALLRLIEARRRQMPAADWASFVAAFPELQRDALGLLHRHYSPARLDTADARAHFVAPDREALPGTG
ncbi:hypothetical protein [Solimonas marina]|uniref:Uncharacterized protein n=1 Tax=Solimonas marina TaxID=2714601 RepID=A0A969W8X8_9GAMM|nr:hypothetical protein [Solimonas marina]NKF22168.1 hypothetical protein [Solimonas marina]